MLCWQLNKKILEFVVNDIKLDINPIQDGIFRGRSWKEGGGGGGYETWHDYTLSKEDPKNI